MTVRIGVDTGGTHTDLVLIDDAGAALLTLKVPSTLGDLSDGILDGLGRILEEGGAAPSAVDRFVYATTMVTNLIVEGVDAPVGLVTTQGFRDVLEIARASRKPHIYDINWRPARPLVPRHRRLTVPERIDFAGKVVTPLDEDAVRAAFAEFAAAGVTSVAVCFLNAYANPVHERRVAEIAAEGWPDIDVSLSSAIVREFREYERMSTTGLNAYVKRPITRHLTRLDQQLRGRGVESAPFIMRGNGGISTFAVAQELPVAVTHSGPMGGIVGGTAIAEACGIKDIITLDMGGTSADVSLVSQGKPVLTTRGKLGPYPLLLPMLDLVTIGAGGGSIAWLDQGTALRVGPRSAGAMPGPACYDQGGADPTVTDSNLLAGRLNPGYFLGGLRKLRTDLAEKALVEKVAGPLGMSLQDAALGVLAIAESHMVNAIRLISVDRGLDPRDFTLVGFGGAGPLHTLRLAEELSIDRVLIPAAPGNVSAMGLLAADVRHDLARTQVTALEQVDPDTLAAGFAEMLQEAEALLAREGVAPERRISALGVDLRYQGQNYELNLPLSGNGLDQAELDALAKRFHDEHQRVYGYHLPTRGIQLVNLRATAIGRLSVARWPEHRPMGAVASAVGSRRIMLAGGITAEAPVYRSTELHPEQKISGPAIVEYPGSTLFMPPGWTAVYDRMRNAHLTRGSRAADIRKV